MKNVLLVLIGILAAYALGAQSLVGAWECIQTDAEGKKVKIVVIFSKNHQVATWYDADNGAFIKTNGGLWKKDGNHITETVEFDTHNPDRVGEEVSFDIFFDGNTMGIVGEDLKWTRIDSGAPGKLQGAWLMSGRIRNGETQSRDTSRPRKTMKILSGTRFQWIAYNTETKQFMGTGGGTYTTIDGKYTENIEFFSRDDSRVGMSLAFDFELLDGHWHHSGLSSKGDPIHEIWSKRL